MNQSYVNDLRSAGVAFDRYRELARPIQDGLGAERWPLVSATNQVLGALRWKREALAPQGNVTQLPTRAAPAPATGSDWFLAENTQVASTGRSRGAIQIDAGELRRCRTAHAATSTASAPSTSGDGPPRFQTAPAILELAGADRHRPLEVSRAAALRQTSSKDESPDEVRRRCSHFGTPDAKA